MGYVQVLLPSVAVGVVFWLVIRWIFAADRSEREALAAAEMRYADKSSPEKSLEQEPTVQE